MTYVYYCGQWVPTVEMRHAQYHRLERDQFGIWRLGPGGARVRAYDPAKVRVTWGDRELTGFADGAFIEYNPSA